MRDRRSELLTVLKEEYGQRETGVVLAPSAAPVLFESPRSIPLVAKWLGYGQERSLSGLDDLLTVFEQSQRQMLILGEPGAGKTTLLVALANRLVQRAIEDDREPIPVILELSAWWAGVPLITWITLELINRYRPLPADQVVKWLKTGQLLPLLDGLDGLQDHQSAAMVAIGQLVSKFNQLAGLVVCGQQANYDAIMEGGSTVLKERLNYRIELQPLDEPAIRTYLHDCERDFLWAEIQQDRAGFRKLAESPLLLDLMVATYDQPGKWQLEPPRNPHDLETHYLDCRDRLLDDYFEAQLHSVAHPKYKPADTRRYLEWLARSMRDRNQTEFLIESMQPDLLGDQLKVYQYCLVSSLTFGPLYGASFGLMFGSQFNLSVLQSLKFGSISGAVLGLFFGLSVGLLVNSSTFLKSSGRSIYNNKSIDLSSENLRFSLQKSLANGSKFAFNTGKFVGLFGVILMIGMFVFGIKIGLNDWAGLIKLIMACSIMGLGIGLFSGLISGLIEGRLKYKDISKPKMIDHFHNALILGIIFWTAQIVTLLPIMLLLRSLFSVSNSIDFISSLLFVSGFSAAMSFVEIQRITMHGYLRWLLECQQVIPQNHEEWLVYVSDQLHFLKRSGGRFRFYHDLLRERIAS